MGRHRQILQILGVVVQLGELFQSSDLTIEGGTLAKICKWTPPGRRSPGQVVTCYGVVAVPNLMDFILLKY